MECKVIEPIRKGMFYIIKDKLIPILDNYKIDYINRVSPLLGPYNPNYLQIYLSKRFSTVYLSNATVEKDKNKVRDIFGLSLVWIDKTPFVDDFWILIRDVEHENSWARIK